MRFVSVLAVVIAFLGITALDVPASPQQGQAQVVLVTSGCSTGAFICNLFARELRRTGVSGRVISPDIREDAVGTLSLLARQGHALVIVDVTQLDALAIVAPRFPKTRFAVFDASLDMVRGSPRNVEAIVQEGNEAAYLAGWLAARLEQRRRGKDVVGAVGGLRIRGVTDLIAGFRAGARSADPGITVLTNYSRDFVDPNKCEGIARIQIVRGAGAVFNVAGACGLGTLRATENAGVWGIGVDTDQSFLGPHILTSVVKKYGVGFAELLRQVRAGKIRTGSTTVLTLRSGGADLGRISPKVPASLRAELARVRDRIINGAIRVPLADRD